MKVSVFADVGDGTLRCLVYVQGDNIPVVENHNQSIKERLV